MSRVHDFIFLLTRGGVSKKKKKPDATAWTLAACCFCEDCSLSAGGSNPPTVSRNVSVIWPASCQMKL